MRFCGLFVPLLVLAASGCGDSYSAKSGLTEPVRVQGGQFFEGSFPASYEAGPQVGQLTIRSLELLQGNPAKSVTGLADAGSQSVALSMQSLGSGFWVVPVGAEDLDSPGKFDWGATMSFANDIPPGDQRLQIAAIDAQGRFGPRATQKLTVKSLLPTGRVVASLTFGVDADLDLHLLGPSGKELSPKHPNSSPLDDIGQAQPGSGLLDRDSLASCVPDGVRAENVVWTEPPEAGVYVVRVDLFNACSKPAANFKFSLYVDGQQVLEQAGRLLDIDADGGASSGLFVTQFTCNEGTGTCS